MGFAAMKRIWKDYMTRHKTTFIAGTVCIVFVSILYAIEIYMLRFIFDGLLAPPNKAHIKPFLDYIRMLRLDRVLPVDRGHLFIYIPVALVAILFAKGIFAYFGKYWMDSVGLSTITDLRNDLYGRMIHHGQDFFARYPTGTLISRLISDIERIKTSVSEKLTELVKESFTLIALIISAMWQDWRLTLISFVAIPLVVYPLARFSKRLRRAARRSQEQMAHLADQMKESITGVRVVQMFEMEDREKVRFRKFNHEVLKANLKATRVMALTTPLMELIGGAAVAGILYYGHFLIVDSKTTMGTFSAFLATLYAMYVPVKKLSQANNIVQQAVTAAERSVEILDRKVAIQESPDAVELPPFSQSIRFEGVDFAYEDNRKVLKGFDLEIPKGEILAIVGSSGAGKSTLVNLVPRLFDVTGGALTIDGHDVRGVTLSSLRRQMGMVTQETVLFDDTVRANIAYGSPTADQEAIEDVAKQALAHDFILGLPQGYDTRIGEAGFALSGGQRQRLAIARALLKNPPILILDEATSALDSESEYLVQQALFNLVQGRTTLIIAHRLATILSARRIIVLDGGRVAESGTHQELLERGGIYTQLCAMEFRAGAPLESSVPR